MTIVIFLQYLAPISALAETLSERAATIHLLKTSQGSEPNELTLEVQTIGGDSDQTVAIDYSLPVVTKVTSAMANDVVALDQATQQLKVKVTANESSKQIIKLSLNADTLKEATTLTFKTNQNSLSYAIPEALVATAPTEESQDVSESSSESSMTESSGGNSQVADTSSTESSEATSTDASVNATGSSSEASTEASTESTDTADSNSKKARAAESTDIRNYFPNGEGTIITGTSVLYTDKDGNPVEPPVTADTNVNLNYQWEIPESVREQIQPGDVFNFKLPDEIKPNRELSGELKNPDTGEVYATYTVDKDGNVQFVFNENVTKESNIKGEFTFDAHFDTSIIDVPGEKTITFPEEDNLPPIDVIIRPNTDKEIDKRGKIDRKLNPTAVEWTVDFNQAMNTLENPKITESWPDGILFQSAKVYALEMNLDGTVKGLGRELSPDEYTIDSNGNIVINGETNSAYRIVYQTEIDQAAKPDGGGDITFVNLAKLTDDHDASGIDAKASVSGKYGKLLTKENAGYDSANQSFSWQIKYNYGEKNIPKEQAVLTDTLSDNLRLEDDSIVIYPTTFNDDGSENKGTPLVEGQDYTLEPDSDGHGFVLRFLHDVDQAYSIEYQTKVDTIVDGSTAVDNSVSVEDGTTAKDEGTAEQQNVIKHVGAVDYANRIVDWSIDVNTNHYEMNDLVLTDTFNPIPGLSMNLRQGASYDFDIRDTTDNRSLFPGQDYDLAITRDDNGDQTGFIVTFKGDYQSTNHQFKLNYRTKFDIKELDPDNPDLDRFINTIGADWTDESNNKHHSEDNQDFKPKYEYALNAEKGGTYNAVDKTITWTIATNLSGNNLQDAILSDQVKDNQDYVADSLEVFEAITEPDGTVVKRDNIADNEKMKSVIEPSSTNDHTWEIDFPDDVAMTYVIEFKTSVANRVIEDSAAYENIAQYENHGDKRNVVGEVDVKNGGSDIQKSGEQNSENPDYVDWHVMINPAQSTLDDVIVEDTPSPNQVIDRDSIQLYPTTVAENGDLTPNMDTPLIEGTDYTVEVITDNVTGQQVMTIKMIGQITTAYYMFYRSFITSSAQGNTDTVTNNINIKGTGSKTVDTDSKTEVTVEIDHSSGNASGQKGTLILQKTDSDGVTPLTGAIFELWDTTKSQLLREGTINDNGQITFGALPLGDYLLFETKAPDGYTVSDSLAKGQRVTVDASNAGDDARPLVLKNERNKVVVHKVDSNGDAINLSEDMVGATFKLEQYESLSLAGVNWKELTLNPNTTNADGELVIESLPVGIYRLTEVSAPTGYVLNSNVSYFIVTKNSNGQIADVNVNVTNYQGSAELIKTDDQGTALTGAEFNVYQSDDKQMANPINNQPIVSDENGVVHVDGLAPGSYFFAETKAPSGYLINSETVGFDISETASGQPQTVTVNQNGDPLTLVDYQGAAVLTKINQSQEGLADAEFDLFNKNDVNHPINETPLVSDENGVVDVDGLAPGDYQFVETKAPEGYLINTTPIEFTIAASAQGQPEAVVTDDLVDYKGAFSLRKVNAAGEALFGADFTLYDSNKQALGLVKTSDREGTITFEDLAPGTYYFKETKAPETDSGGEYVINPAFHKVVIPTEYAGDPGTINLGDFQNFLGTAKVTKTGEGGSIAGATFELYRNYDGEEILEKTIVVGENGELDLTNLEVGSYKLVETKAASGYIINTQPIYFVVQENDDVNPVIDNLNFENYQSEVVGKKISALGEPLSGATYQIFVADENGQPTGDAVTVLDRNGAETDTISTDSQGEIYGKGLEVGKYVLVETQAPEGYILDTTVHPFEVSEQLGDPTPIELGNFVNYKGAAQLTKVSEDGILLSGAEFNVFRSDGSQVNVTPLVSDENGVVSIDNLTPGAYLFVETKAPEDYLINQTPIPFTIDGEAEGKPAISQAGALINYQGSVQLKKINQAGKSLAHATFKIVDMDDQTVQDNLISGADGLLTASHLAPGKYQFVETQAPDGYLLNEERIDFEISTAAVGEPTVVEIGDYINYTGSAELTKTDAAGNGLAGAEFSVTDSSGEVVREKVISDENGLVQVTDLAPGVYQFVETQAPEGYIINSTPIDFTISPSTAGEPAVVEAGELANYQGTAELLKTDEAGNGLAGAAFSVIDTAGEVIQENIVSDENGLVHATVLAPGDYQFVETQAPEGYIINSTPIDFTISASTAGEPAVVKAEDLVNYQGTARLKKVDEAGNGLANAVFKVVDNSGHTIQENLISNKEGLVTISNLAPGSYQFVETKAPAGYILNTEAVSFDIAIEAIGEPDMVDVGMYMNYQGSAQLIKTDELGNPLSGAKFNVIASDGTLINIDPIVSNEQGVVEIHNLAPGSYRFVEIEAPTGYQLNSDARVFTIDEASVGKPTLQSVGTFVNKKTPGTPNKPSNPPKKLPKTNDQNLLWIQVVGVILIISVVVTFVILRRKKGNK